MIKSESIDLPGMDDQLAVTVDGVTRHLHFKEVHLGAREYEVPESFFAREDGSKLAVSANLRFANYGDKDCYRLHLTIVQNGSRRELITYGDALYLADGDEWRRNLLITFGAWG